MAEVKTEAKPEAKADFYGPYGKLKRPETIPAPGVVINGNLWLGRRELTYDEKANVFGMLSARMTHELGQRMGHKDAQKIIDMSGAASSSDLF